MAISFAILKQSRVILSFVLAVQAGRVHKLCIVPDPIPFQVTGIVIHSRSTVCREREWAAVAGCSNFFYHWLCFRQTQTLSTVKIFVSLKYTQMSWFLIFHILLQKWFATYFELVVLVQLCISSSFRSRLVIGWLQNLSQNFVWVALVRVTTDTTCLLSFFKGGFLPNVFKALAHRPDEFRAFFMYYDALMLKEGNLTKAEKEMIVVATSAANNCTYCVIAHGALLRIYSKNPLLGDQVNFCLYSYYIWMINSPWTGSQAEQGKKGNWWAKQAKCGVGEKKWWGRL